MNTALVSLTFDDGLRCQFERAVPVLDRNGLPGTFFLVANTDPIHTDGVQHPNWYKTTWTAEDVDFLRDMLGRGHEVGAHSMTHRHPNLDNNPDFEAKGSKDWIESRLGLQVSSYCYPFCHVTSPIRSAVENAGYRQARGGAKGSFLCPSQVDFLNLDCRLITQHEDVGAWIRPGCWHILMYHGIGTTDDGWEPISVSEFERQMIALTKMRESGAVDVVTFKDGAERIRQYC